MTYLFIDSTQLNFRLLFIKGDSCYSIQRDDFADSKDNIVKALQILIGKHNKLALKDLEFIGVISGPGSYTGLRLGIALANGLSLALNIPILNVSWFLLMYYEWRLANNNAQDIDHLLLTVPNNKGSLFAQKVDVKKKIFSEPFELNPESDYKGENLIVMGIDDKLAHSVLKINHFNLYPSLLKDISVLQSAVKLCLTKHKHKATYQFAKALYIKDPKITISN